MNLPLLDQSIGITERGDAGLDFTWEKKIYNHPFSILITKNLNNNFINKVKNLNNVIVHATITGYGGGILEPNVPRPEWSFDQLRSLIETGFPIERIVLRVDPVFATIKGMAIAMHTIDTGIELGIKRIRFSYVDMYPHVQKRFEDAGIPIKPFDYKNVIGSETFYQLRPGIRLESCAEGLETDIGCISEYDFELFGIKPTTSNINRQQRKHCKCLACKTELLENKYRCYHQCLYCYWKDANTKDIL